MKKIGFFVIVLSFICTASFGEKLQYNFLIPSFGGNPLGSNHFMERALVFRPPEVIPEVEPRTQADYFLEQLQRRALSTLSSGLLAELQDPSSASSGSYYFDDFSLSYEKEDDSIIISIDDGINIVEIDLPSYDFVSE